MACADRINQYIDAEKPWIAVKDPLLMPDVHAVCSMGLNLFRLLIIYLKPVLPDIAQASESFLNIDPLLFTCADKPLLDHKIHAFVPLIQRVDPVSVQALINESQAV